MLLSKDCTATVATLPRCVKSSIAPSDSSSASSWTTASPSALWERPGEARSNAPASQRRKLTSLRDRLQPPSAPSAASAREAMWPLTTSALRALDTVSVPLLLRSPAWLRWRPFLSSTVNLNAWTVCAPTCRWPINYRKNCPASRWSANPTALCCTSSWRTKIPRQTATTASARNSVFKKLWTLASTVVRKEPPSASPAAARAAACPARSRVLVSLS
mmetsp:Transcript_20216/g.29670  ORF Transcript_20216/g.29670 Transcript_20216/m.29670 type:complete len:217 (+) Transcript_20216:173-823(+)